MEDDDKEMEDVAIVRDGTNIRWLHSAAREILLEDLIKGNLDLDNSVVSAEEAWEFYKKLPEFRIVPFRQFKKQLSAHREQVGRLDTKAIPQIQAFEREQRLHPPTFNHRSSPHKPHFFMLPEYHTLREDVRQKRNIGMTPSQFRQTRTEYMQLPLTAREFKDRVYQAQRYVKYCNMLEEKREELLTQPAKKKNPPSKKRKGNPK